MMRIALGVESDGANFSGWQVQQKGVRTVQACVETALSKVANHPLGVACAGRTDAGVHALGQVCHLETQAQRPSRAWIRGTNSHLPEDISILWSLPVPDTFHARFSALARRYRYLILNRAVRSALHRQRATWFCRPLDVERMAQAARSLVGEHDFTSFRAVACQSRTPVRSVYTLEVTRKDDFVILEVEANGFLHHMVRNIAGVLMAVGTGVRPVHWAQQVLESRDRTLGGVTAPPEGLYLIHVRYPAMFRLPGCPPATRLW
jgi:tRNA pseudouridine38-40 synthase